MATYRIRPCARLSGEITVHSAKNAVLPLMCGALLTQARHIDAAMRAAKALEEMADAIEGGMPLDFASVDATSALRALGEITGEDAEEGVLDAVFANFCVGK